MGLVLLITPVLITQPAYGAVGIGSTCSKVGESKTTLGQKLICKKSGAKKVWSKAKVVVQLPAPQTSQIPVSGVEVLLSKVSETILKQPLTYPVSGTAQISSAIVTLLPGEETGSHRHDAPMYAYILEGTVQVTYEGGIVKIYETGDSIMEAVGIIHNGKNIGNGTLRILVVNIGATGVENTVKL